MFNIRLITLDHYISKPIDELYVNKDENVMKECQEPVLRIFGTTSQGFKSCVHVHGVYPYIYIPYKGGENPHRDALLIGAALDEALKTSLNTKSFRFVHEVILVSGIPLYGYHSKLRQFLKIYFYNPYHIRKASELLLSGAILGQKFQPHEAHIPYTLQFMMDYNIYGMSFVTFSKVKYRRNPENPDCLIGIREEDILPDAVKKITCSHLEVDALASDIMNRMEQEAVRVNPGLRAIWENEKDRRREQKRSSQISIQLSQARPGVKMCSVEAIYKAQLAQKLKQISSQELGIKMATDETMYSYAAEVPEIEDIVEASATYGSIEFSRVEEPVFDVGSLIDHRILSQISENQKEKAESESEEDELEVDSVLGRNQKAEEEAELEDEEGVDMTQPLDLDEEVIRGAAGEGEESGNRNTDEAFWKSMASQIYQLDGAQESSSESDTETAPLTSASGDGTSGNSLEPSSAWSSNIMSILSEDSGCPTPSAVCQTPRTFWSNYSPNWLPQNQDTWTWNKNSGTFSDFGVKNQSESLNLTDFSGVSKELFTEDPYENFFISNGGEYFPTSTVAPFWREESLASPPSAILTPTSDAEGSDINLGSICENFQSPAKEEKCSLGTKFTETKRAFNRKPEDDRQKCLQVLKGIAGKKVPAEEDSGHLTLKQFIKDCEEIVSVDFKNLCNQEMVIIEYKSQNKRSLKNKYLIKPLDKFLESWNSAEKRASDLRLPKNSHGPTIINGFDIEEGKNLRSVINVLEKRFSDSSTVQSVSNKLTVKSMEILPKGGGGKERSYNVNQNVISQGRIKMKLIKSQRENLEKNLVESTLKRRRSEKCFKLNLSRLKAGTQKRIEKAKVKIQGQGGRIQKSQKVGKYKKWKNLPEPDSKLINDINSNFEEYFKSIVRRKNCNRKKKNIIESANDEQKKAEEEEEEEEEETTSEDEKAKVSPIEKRRVQRVHASSNADPIKFVTRFLTTFSRMSNIPPLSITISLGNPRLSVPVQMNLQPVVPSPEKEINYYRKKTRSKMKLENVDGPADGSSSEESTSGDSKQFGCLEKRQKKTKREGFYKPLNVIVYGSTTAKNERGQKRKTSAGGNYEKEKEEEKEAKKKREKKCFLKHPFEAFCNPGIPGFPQRFLSASREKPKSQSPYRGKKEKIPNQNSVKSSADLENIKKSSFDVKVLNLEKPVLDSCQEQDFIDESDEEKKFKHRSLKLPKMEAKALLKKIPQADTQGFFSSDDDDLKDFTKKMSGNISRPEKVILMEKPEAMIRDDGSKERLDFCGKPSFDSEDAGEMSREKMNGAEPANAFSNEIFCSRNFLLAERKQVDSQEYKNLKCGFLESKISVFSNPDGFANSGENLLTQPTISLFPLSGNLLLETKLNSAETKSDALSLLKTLIYTEEESPLTQTLKNSNPLENSKSFFRPKCSGSSKLDCQEAERTPSSEVEISSLNWVIGCKKIWSKQKPLTVKEMVEAVQHNDIIENEENIPFYGDPRDVTKSVETGPRVLKIENRSMAGLRPFKSSLNILGIEERRALSTKKQERKRSCLIGDAYVTITPLLKPPSSETVLIWLFSKNDPKNREKALEKVKMKVVNPLSPGQETEFNEEMDEGVTIDSLSEESKKSSVINKIFPPNLFQGKNTRDINDKEITLKKGPFSKIKGNKRFCSLNKLARISEEEQPPEGLKNAQICRSASCNPVSSKENKKSSENSFQIKGVTLDNSFGFSHSVEDLQNGKLNETHQHMNMLVVEVHVQTRKDLRPDPYQDPIRALFYAITSDCLENDQEKGILVVGEEFLYGSAVLELTIHYVATEKALFEKLLDLVKVWDPEILAGHEIEMHSWGYIVQRGFILKMNLLLLLGRVKTEDFTKKNSWDFFDSSADADADEVPRSVRHMRISGRIVLDVWRVLRHEVALTSYSFENVLYHLSHERRPLLSYESLSHYWEHPSQKFKHIVVEYYATKVLGVIRILDQLDFISRTSELSRLFGIQFYEVLSRGSQFRVESMMLRLAKPLNYVSVSPSIAQRAAMRAPASLPLILEPESLFYADPVIVLDFQSLYPSIIIAYNYCFSTCLGRVEKLGGREPFEFGCTQFQISPEELKNLENDLTISPAGVAFVNANVRKGVLPTMLEEILETRLMVKKSMKENKENKTLQKILFARQLGLKLIANVTYGYTAANFSGRMPCTEVGDSVVSKGRETLHRAIQLVKSTRKWGARVVYGDTDSIFVLIPGRSREEAFKIGAEIAEAVTHDNPKPVKLKLEKVYQPSILQTKKRYLGYMFETPDQEKPVFEAKGIETVRRDGCPAIAKILQKALQILFDTRDMSLVKKYTMRQFVKLFQGRVNLQDLIFAKEYRGRKGYRKGACVPALYLAKQWTQYDKRAEPRIKERVPYVIVSGPPDVPLIRLVRSPKDLISDPSLRTNAIYYITKAIIPPMQRCFSLLGANVAAWFSEMPRMYHKMYKSNCIERQKKSTISQYFAAMECIVCYEVTSAPVCSKCEKQSQKSVLILNEKVRLWERCHEGLSEICRSCCGSPAELKCGSLDCPVLFRRIQAERALDQGPLLREILVRYF